MHRVILSVLDSIQGTRTLKTQSTLHSFFKRVRSNARLKYRSPNAAAVKATERKPGAVPSQNVLRASILLIINRLLEKARDMLLVYVQAIIIYPHEA